MYKVQNWKDMSSWLKFFVVLYSIVGVAMLALGVAKYLSGDLNRAYFRELLIFFIMVFAGSGMFGLFVKTESEGS